MSHDQSIDRRGFLAGATAAACATGFVGASVAGASSSSASALFDLTCGDFAKLIGTGFHVVGTDETQAPLEVTLVLRQADDRSHPSDKLRASHLRPSGFSLLFEASSEQPLADGTHLVSAGGLPPCQVFMSPRVDDRYPHLRHYEAIFS